MAEAPSLRISTRSTASRGMMFRSANTFWPSSARPYGATRRPFSSTRVEDVPRPRSEMPEAPEAKPPPKVVGTEPWLSTARVCSNSATLDLPDFSISAAFRVCTGEAVSASARRMLEPVISTRAIGAAFCVSCAIAGRANRVLANARPSGGSDCARKGGRTDRLWLMLVSGKGRTGKTVDAPLSVGGAACPGFDLHQLYAA